MAIFVPSDLKWYIQGKKEQIYCVFLNLENNHILLRSIKSIICKWFPYTFLTFKSIWFCSNFHVEKHSKCDWQDTQIMQILSGTNKYPSPERCLIYIKDLSKGVRFAANQQPGPMCTTACTYVGLEHRFAKRFFITLLFLSTTQVLIFIDTNMVEKHGGIFELRSMTTQVWASSFSLHSP